MKTMRPTKTINALLNDSFDACFTLEFMEDEQGGEYGILTAPYVKWLSRDESVVDHYVKELSGKVLECIEKYYFDRDVITIPVKGYPNSVALLDVVFNAIPSWLHEQMLAGTFTESDEDIGDFEKYDREHPHENIAEGDQLMAFFERLSLCSKEEPETPQ